MIDIAEVAVHAMAVDFPIPMGYELRSINFSLAKRDSALIVIL